MTPRPYQQRTIDELWSWFETEFKGNPIVEACVGAGKSPMIAWVCQRAIEAYPQTRVLVLTHQTELLLQNLEKLRKVWPEADVGVCSADLGKKVLHRRITYATIGSVYRVAAKLGKVDLIFADECHMVPSEDKGMWRKVIEILEKLNPHVRVIGWTGTPFRGNGIWLTAGKDPIFTHIATRVTMTELLDLGFLSPLVTVKTGITADTTQVASTSEDYVVADLEKVMIQDDMVDIACADLVERAVDRKRLLVYCVTIAHALKVCAKLRSLGVDAMCVTSETSSGERSESLNRFRVGRLRCLVNVAVLTTGFDVPEVDCIALLRPTKSPVLYVQIGGRGMRIVGGKTDCLWLDYTSTTIEQGPIDRVRGRKPRGSKPDEAPFKICDGCGTQVALSTKVCKVCGFVFPVEDKGDAHGGQPTDAPILSKGDARKTRVITDVTYHLHRKADSPVPTLRADYWSGMVVVASEWAALSHQGYGRMKAESWWRGRSKIPQIPASSQEALTWLEYDKTILEVPTKIVTIKDGQYERITEYSWTSGGADGVDDQQAEPSQDDRVPLTGVVQA